MLFMVRPDAKSVTLLADILETIEMTADELLDQRFAPHDLALVARDADGLVQGQLAALRDFVQRLRELELSLITQLEQARVRAQAVARSDWRLRPIMALFTSGTQALADRIISIEGRAALRFDGGDEVFPFLRSRELLVPLAAHYDGSGELLVTDSFRLLGMIKLSDLMERCEVALNALDAHYDLYEWPEDAAIPQTAEEAPLVIASAVAAAMETAPVEVVSAPVEAAWDAVIAALEPVIGPTNPVKPEADEATVTNWGETVVVASPDPAKAEAEAIAIAEAEAEDALKSLTERLADLKAAEPVVAAEAAADAPKSDAA
jgi:hypothetical protein